MVFFPNAKINLGLRILRKREDGFHDIHSLMLPIGWHDSLELDKSTEPGLSFTQYGIELGPGKNIVTTCYELFQTRFDIGGVQASLVKGVPPGAGLGGGSADAAFMAIGLNQLFELGLRTNELESIVAEVGSDCPFFINNAPAIVEGRGEIISPFELDLSGLNICVVNPGIHISTPEAYSNCFISGQALDMDLLDRKKIDSWQENITNDFEPYAFEAYPEIQNVRDKLLDAGAVYAAMSGSGSSVFGVFENRIQEMEWPDHYQSWSGAL